MARASSDAGTGSALPRRQPASAVICSLASESWLRSAIASLEPHGHATSPPARAGDGDLTDRERVGAPHEQQEARADLE